MFWCVIDTSYDHMKFVLFYGKHPKTSLHFLVTFFQYVFEFSWFFSQQKSTYWGNDAINQQVYTITNKQFKIKLTVQKDTGTYALTGYNPGSRNSFKIMAERSGEIGLPDFGKLIFLCMQNAWKYSKGTSSNTTLLHPVTTYFSCSKNICNNG